MSNWIKNLQNFEYDPESIDIEPWTEEMDRKEIQNRSAQKLRDKDREEHNRKRREYAAKNREKIRKQKREQYYRNRDKYLRQKRS